MGDGLDARADQAPESALLLTAALLQAVVAQGEPVQRVHLAGQQTVAGQTKADEVGQLCFRQAAIPVVLVEAMVGQQSVLLLHFAHGHAPAVVVTDLVTRREADTGQGCIAQGVLARLSTGRIEQGEQAVITGQNGAEAQVGFTVTDPALAGLVLLGHANLRVF